MNVIEGGLTDAEIVERVRLLHTGEGQVLVAFSIDELEAIAVGTSGATRERSLVAIDLLDRDRAVRLRELLREADA